MTDSLGSHWDWADYMPDVMDPGCKGEIKRYTSVIDGYEKDRLIHSIAYNKNSRKNVALMVSYDEGKTWPHKRSLQLEASTYSTFDIDKNGNILVLYEESSWPCSSNIRVDYICKDRFQKLQKLNWCLHDDETDQQYKNSYPYEAYKFNTKVFDQYVESYVLYPAQVTYTVTHKFRDFISICQEKDWLLVTAITLYLVINKQLHLKDRLLIIIQVSLSKLG